MKTEVLPENVTASENIFFAPLNDVMFKSVDELLEDTTIQNMIDNLIIDKDGENPIYPTLLVHHKDGSDGSRN